MEQYRPALEIFGLRHGASGGGIIHRLASQSKSEYLWKKAPLEAVVAHHLLRSVMLYKEHELRVPSLTHVLFEDNQTSKTTSYHNHTKRR